MTETPFYDLVPKGMAENLLFRERMLERGRADPQAAHDLYMMCSRDPLFWINTMVWTFDPLKKADAPVIPFISYPYQDAGFIAINDAIGSHDVLVKKSRDTGATWLVLLVFYHRWSFKNDQSFLVASRNDSYVDESGNRKTLFAKLDFIYDNTPRWLRPRRLRTQGRFENLDTDSQINGESATGDLGRGDRRTAMLWDEVAAWERSDGYRADSSTLSATSCRIIVSTPQGVGNIYADMAKKTRHQLTFHWSNHPEKNRGLYTSKDGVLKVLDAGYVFPKDYEFICDGKLRSIFYDKECERTPIPSVIAQELDIDFLGSGIQFFDSASLAKAKTEFARAPYHVGEFSYTDDGVPSGYLNAEGGKLALWMTLAGDAEMPCPPSGGEYVIGADIAAGTGASNSVLVVADKRTGEKVAEYVYNRIRPEELAKYAVALARWFNDAFLIWEANGPGRQFGSQVLDLGYRTIYYRHDETKFPKKESQVPGFYSTDSTKRVLLTDYGLAIARGDFVERSKEALNECAEIVYLDDGCIGHVRSSSVMDPSGAGDNHADRVIASALCWKGMRERPFYAKAEEAEIAPNSFAGRRAARAKAALAGASSMSF